MSRLFFLIFLLPLVFASCAQRANYRAEESVEEAIVIKPQKQELIVVDAGHGGKDGGTASSLHEYKEKELTLSTAHMVKEYLEYLGYAVVMTRSTDVFIPLAERASIANALKANLFVSLHYNHSPSESAEGVEIFYYQKEPNARSIASKAFAKETLVRILKHTEATSRGVKEGNFAVIRETKMPAILIEAGFLSNPDERAKVKDATYRRHIAYAVARAVDNFLFKNHLN